MRVAYRSVVASRDPFDGLGTDSTARRAIAEMEPESTGASAV